MILYIIYNIICILRCTPVAWRMRCSVHAGAACGGGGVRRAAKTFTTQMIESGRGSRSYMMPARSSERTSGGGGEGEGKRE